MHTTPRSARRRRSLVGAGVATVLCAGLVVGDGLVTTAPAEAAGQPSGLTAASVKSLKSAGKKLKQKGFGIFGTRGAELTDGDLEQPTPGSFVQRQFIGDESAAPKSLASTEILVGPTTSIPSTTRTYAAATEEEAAGVAVKHKSVWTRVKNGWYKSIVSLFGRSITPEMQVEAAIQTRLDPDSANVQKGKYRKRLAVAGVSVEVESSWSGDRLQSVGIVDEPEQHSVPSSVDVASAKGFWHGSKKAVAKKADLKDWSGGMNSASALLDSGEFLIEGDDRTDPSRPATARYLSVSPYLESTTGDVFYGKKRPGKPKHDLAIVEKAILSDGSRLVDVWSASASGTWIDGGQRVLPPKGWAKQHLIPAQKYLMASGTSAPETTKALGLPGGWDVVEGSYGGLKLSMIVGEKRDGTRTPQFTWVRG